MTSACKDCGSTTRKLKSPGPRCATCARIFRKRASEAQWGSRLIRTYNITPEQYWALYEAQGGRCAWCQRATGKTKRLAVDHDHKCCPGRTSCGKCVRGLLCGPDNQTIGRFGDNPETIERGAKYLRNPPAIGVIYAPQF